MKKSFIIIIIYIFAYNNLHSQDEEIVAKFEARTHSYNDITLPYRLFIPEAYDSMKIYPLVLVLHGIGGRGNDNLSHIQNSRMATSWADPINQEKYPCFVVAPQCPSNSDWTNPLQIPETVNDILDSLVTEFSIDENRIYVSGVSMGGFGTWHLINLYPDRFAAAVPMCGGGHPDDIENIAHIPVWNFHGQQDNTVPVHYSRIIMNAYEEIGYQVIYTHSHYRDHTGLPDNIIEMYIKAHSHLIYTEYPRKRHTIADQSYDYPHLFPWVFSKYKLQTDVIKISNLTSYRTLSDTVSIQWNAINPEDSIEIWFSPDNGEFWQLIAKSLPNTGSYSWNTNNTADCFPGLIKIFLKNSYGFIYGYDKSNIFAINNEMNGIPYVKILNNDFIINIEITEPEIDLKLLIGDAEDDSLNIYLYYSSDNGTNYALFDSFITIPDTNFQTRSIPLSSLKYTSFARIKVTVSDGNSIGADNTYYFRNSAGTVHIVSKNMTIPDEFILFQNYPNPFNQVTTIKYTVGAYHDTPVQHVNLSIYNILGQKVATLVSETQPAGAHKVEWDASKFSSGMFFIKMQARDFVDVKKCMLLK